MSLPSETSQISVVADETQPDRAAGVPDRIGDQLADQRFGDERGAVQPHRDSRSATFLWASATTAGIGRQIPRGDVVGVQRVRARHEEGEPDVAEQFHHLLAVRGVPGADPGGRGGRLTVPVGRRPRPGRT
ncbi:hypothetical protein [Actinomadura rubrobrunea]|uniref:hypothetical protein n=1 Tax=Actinomadura rubrobrunea TaxID=115335 RepID=UPI0011B20146|nr:hypothetical protein [Actinomadura rubrobrunea]